MQAIRRVFPKRRVQIQRGPSNPSRYRNARVILQRKRWWSHAGVDASVLRELSQWPVYGFHPR